MKTQKQSRQKRLEIYRRIDEAFTAAGYKTQTARAKIAGVDQGTVSKWKHGDISPRPLNMLDIAEATGYEFNWLWSGRGPKLTPPNDPIADRLNRILHSVDPQTQAEILAVAEALAAAKRQAG